MSVLDRVRRTPEQITGDLTSPVPSSIQAAADKSLVVKRLKIVINRLTVVAQHGPNNKYGRYAWVMQGIIDEVMDEMADDVNDEQLAAWFEQFGKIVEWCGTGDDSVLPASVRAYLADSHPEMLAITAGND